jgi:hypothetical protein
MFARRIGLAIVAVLFVAISLQTDVSTTNAQGAKKDALVKDKKFAIPKNAIAGKIKSVNLKTASFTIVLSTGKDRTFAVDDKTEFWGPKGGDRGTGATGLKDDCMEKGYEVKVVAANDGKVAKDVYLDVRKTEKKTEEKKK